ncbi:peptidase S8/S53 domain-containing protein [Mycena maculata]|uniref:Peptidase S8/S53 domain-containing protein n=1 Tax=Mycena maculata TaxID=230809 RepID=A0AAD7HEB5_9AGAR|nr:peptidase S8/S53 domain-containing protein [Mycena maculata]
MAATDVKFYVVELRSGSILAPARIAHLNAVKAWCKANEPSNFRREMLHDSLDYYAYTGQFTAAVVDRIKADTTVVDAVNDAQPVKTADTGIVVSNSLNWWLTTIAPVPPAVLATLPKVAADEVWFSPTTQGEGVDVYVVDEGFGPNLAGDADFYDRNVEKLWPGKYENEAEPRYDEETIEKENEHGYYVARLAAGYLSSPAPKSNLWWISMLTPADPDRVTNIGAMEALSEVWKRIDIHRSARTSVINCSWGTNPVKPGRDILARLCQKIAEKVVFVAACGNHGKPMNKVQPVPAWVPEVISVGCLEWDGTLARFSNWGDRVDLYAPGTGFRMTDSQGFQSDNQGTSFSAPLVTGAVACLLSGANAAHHSLTPIEVRELLLSRAVNITIQKPRYEPGEEPEEKPRQQPDERPEKPRRAKKLLVRPYLPLRMG